MGNAVLLSLLITTITSMLLLAGCAIALWKRGSRSTRPKKPPDSPEATQISQADLARVLADQAELFSVLGKLTTTVKRLSSRYGMEDLRGRESTREPPTGTPKAELLRHYGMSGKLGPDFARAQMQLRPHDAN